MSWRIRSGPHPVLQKDNAWAWEIERNGEARRVLVGVTTRAMELSVDVLPEETAQARRTQGRNAVENILDREDPPGRITLGSMTSDRDVLRAQLTELNLRSRWYSSQLWYVSFAYIGVTGVAISTAAGTDPSLLQEFLWFCSGFGVMVTLHMVGVIRGERRAVQKLIEVEELLELEHAWLPQLTRDQSVLSLALVVPFASIGYLVIGFFA